MHESATQKSMQPLFQQKVINFIKNYSTPSSIVKHNRKLTSFSKNCMIKKKEKENRNYVWVTKKMMSFEPTVHSYTLWYTFFPFFFVSFHLIFSDFFVFVLNKQLSFRIFMIFFMTLQINSIFFCFIHCSFHVHISERFFSLLPCVLHIIWFSLKIKGKKKEKKTCAYFRFQSAMVI